MPFADANGLRLYYEEHGDGDPVVAVMGLAVDHLAWALQIQPFAARHRLVVFDNRDVGRSSYAEEAYELSDMAADTLALADHLGLERFHLLGVSMGGAIAQHVAAAAPARVRTLTLAVTWGVSGEYARAKARAWSAEARSVTREEFVDSLLLLNHSEAFYEVPGAIDAVRDIVLSNPHPQTSEAFARQLRASTRHDARGFLHELTMPVHVISGAHDILVPPWKQEELAGLIPGARLTVLPGALHGLNVERAEEFNDAVLGFIAEHAGEPAPA